MAVEPTLKDDEPLISTPAPPKPKPKSKAPKSAAAAPKTGKLELEGVPTLVPAIPKPIDPELDGDNDESEPESEPKPEPGPAEPPLPAPEQLWILVKFIEDHFRETVEELERLKEDGYMSFKLLWTLCAPGSVVEAEDEATEYPAGVRVESWSFGNE